MTRRLSATLLALSLICLQAIRAQTIDKTLASTLGPAELQDLYEICRHSTLTPEQQKDLSALLSEKNAMFMEFFRQNDGFLTLEQEKQLTGMKEFAMRKVMSDEQLMQYFRYLATSDATRAGHEARDAVAAQMNLTYMERKYINNTFYVIEQESYALRMLYKGQTKRIREEIQKVYEREIGYLIQKSGIFVDRDMKATRKFILNDYAPLTPETAKEPAE